MLRQLRLARADKHRRNLVPTHPISHNPCVRHRIAIFYERPHCCYPRRNRCLGTTDRILRIHRQNMVTVVPFRREAKSTSMEKRRRDGRLWSEHGLLDPNRGTRCTRDHHWRIPALFRSLNARLSHWSLDCPVRTDGCFNRTGPA